MFEEIEGFSYPLGITLQKDCLHIAMRRNGDSCGVILYNSKKEEIRRISDKEMHCMGEVLYASFKVPRNSSFFYQFYSGEKIYLDSYTHRMETDSPFGKPIPEEQSFGVVSKETFDWGDETSPAIPFEDCILYQAHVRGFTKHKSSGVRKKGTFLGMCEKKEYLLELGVNALELMPIVPLKKGTTISYYGKNPEMKYVNYWGFSDAFYFCPNPALAYGKDAVSECKQMVRAFHESGIEILLQFYFPKGTEAISIRDVLLFWKEKYHVDGFRLIGEEIPFKMLIEDPYLKDCKILTDWVDADVIYPNAAPIKKQLGLHLRFYSDTMKRFLKGDDDTLHSAMELMRQTPGMFAPINSFSDYDAFTMMDMVSYERKHNESNHEENRDGYDLNYSWNCGQEGPSRKRAVKQLREKQLRNAFCMLFFSQGTPHLLMGDEFGQSRMGNNNPYCQDNEINYLDWRNVEKQKELLSFVKTLIAFRKEHPIFHSAKPIRLMDYISCGFPDLSYHAESAWQANMASYYHHMGMLYYGKYEGEDCFFFIAMNMHWEEHSFALPHLPEGYKFTKVLDTTSFDFPNIGTELEDNCEQIPVKERSIVLLVSKMVPVKKQKKRKSEKK